MRTVYFYVSVLCLGSGLDKLVSSLSDLRVRLNSRTKVSPAVFAESMKLREETHHLGITLLSLLLVSDLEVDNDLESTNIFCCNHLYTFLLKLLQLFSVYKD